MRRRNRLGWCAAAAWLLAMPAIQSAEYWLYAGTYTNQQSKGIYGFRFDSDAGKLTAVGLAAESASPSFLAASPDGRFLYAVNEVSEYKGRPSGSVSAFRIDRKTGQLIPLNTVSSGGPGPCHLAAEKTGRCVLVANYAGGSVAALPIGPDGRLGEAASFFQHRGSGAQPDRQAGPHAHCIAFSPDNRFALVADLGLDQVLVYRLDAARARLAPNEPAFAKTTPGAGPRHLAFHPNGRMVYSVNELQSSITVFDYARESGRLRERQTISTLPEGFQGASAAAEIAVHSSGKFLYASNRGDDSIAVFAIDPSGSSLHSIQHVPTGGKTPRNFAIDPTGKYLLAANQDSNNIVVFKIEPATGRLAPSGQPVASPTPVCLTFVR